MRVTYVVDGDGWGGAETVLAALIRHLPPEVEVSVIATSPVVAERLLEGRDITPVMLTSKRRVNPFGVLAWRRAIASTRPDIVHINLPWPLAALHAQLAAASMPGAKRVLHEHMPVPPRTFVQLAFKRLLSLRAVEVAVSSRSAEDLSGEYGFRSSGISVIPNGTRAAAVVGGSSDGKQLVCVGRLTPQKGFDLAIRALAELPDYRLRIVGSRSTHEAAALESVARERGVGSRVVVLPWCESISEALAEADIVLMPSRHEAAPLGLLEALVRGCPVVASDVGNAREVLAPVDEELLFAPGDVGGLVRAVNHLADPYLRQKVADAGRSLVLSSYPESVTATYCLDLYRRWFRN